MKKVFFFGLGLVLFGCSNSTQDTYITLCVQNGGSEKMCSCIYDKMEGHFGREKMQFFLDNMNNPSMSSDPKLIDGMVLSIMMSRSSCVAKGIKQ